MLILKVCTDVGAAPGLFTLGILSKNANRKFSLLFLVFNPRKEFLKAAKGKMFKTASCKTCS